MTDDTTSVGDVFASMGIGFLSSISLIIGALIGVYRLPNRFIRSSSMAFGSGALIEATCVEIFASMLFEKDSIIGPRETVAYAVLGALFGGFVFSLLNHVLNDQGAYSRKESTIRVYIRSKIRTTFSSAISKKLRNIPLFTVIKESTAIQYMTMYSRDVIVKKTMLHKIKKIFKKKDKPKMTSIFFDKLIANLIKFKHPKGEELFDTYDSDFSLFFILNGVIQITVKIKKPIVKNYDGFRRNSIDHFNKIFGKNDNVVKSSENESVTLCDSLGDVISENDDYIEYAYLLTGGQVFGELSFLTGFDYYKIYSDDSLLFHSQIEYSIVATVSSPTSTILALPNWCIHDLIETNPSVVFNAKIMAKNLLSNFNILTDRSIDILVSKMELTEFETNEIVDSTNDNNFLIFIIFGGVVLEDSATGSPYGSPLHLPSCSFCFEGYKILKKFLNISNLYPDGVVAVGIDKVSALVLNLNLIDKSQISFTGEVDSVISSMKKVTESLLISKPSIEKDRNVLDIPKTPVPPSRVPIHIGSLGSCKSPMSASRQLTDDDFIEFDVNTRLQRRRKNRKKKKRREIKNLLKNRILSSLHDNHPTDSISSSSSSSNSSSLDGSSNASSDSSASSENLQNISNVFSRLYPDIECHMIKPSEDKSPLRPSISAASSLSIHRMHSGVSRHHSIEHITPTVDQLVIPAESIFNPEVTLKSIIHSVPIIDESSTEQTTVEEDNYPVNRRKDKDKDNESNSVVSSRQMSSLEAQSRHMALMVWCGILVDAIPESLVIGIFYSTSAISSLIAFVIGVFLSNIPEAMSSSGILYAHGMSRRKIMFLWLSVVIVTGVGAAIGSLIFPPSSVDDPGSLRFQFVIKGVAGGAMVAMISNTALPEAFHQGGDIVGMSALFGFVCAYFVSGFS